MAIVCTMLGIVLSLEYQVQIKMQQGWDKERRMFQSEVTQYRETVRRYLVAVEKLDDDFKEFSKPKELFITAYSPSIDQTDSTPHITAFQTRVKAGGVAVSRDLFQQGWTFGKRVYIEGEGVFVINDLMHPRWIGRIDLFRWNREDAIKFGLKKRRVVLFTI